MSTPRPPRPPTQAEDKDLHGAAAQGSKPVGSDSSAPALPSSVIHLDFFSGIGSASLALQRLGVSIRHVMSWEVDEAAIAVARRASRRTTKSQRGSLLDDTPAAAAEAIECIPGGAADLIVITAAAPCPDFSRIRSDNAPGRSGPSGNLFVRFTAFLQALLNLLPGRRACLLAENVLMHNPADTQWFSKQLDAEAVLADASDYGAIHRPRLWWSWTDWSAVRLYPGKASELKSTKQGKVPQLVLDVPKDSLQDLQPEGLVFHEKVLRREILLPCLTTPAIEEGGREAPRNMKGKIDSITRTRWLEGRRQYAPWFFAETAMLRDSDSKLHLLPIETKEALHHFDRDFSSCPNVTLKDRHRLLGNSWHVGVATEMLRFSLLYGVRSLPGPHAAGASDVSGVIDLESAKQLASRHPLPMRRTPEMCDHVDMQPADDMWAHWLSSAEAVHPLHQRPSLDPALELTLQRLLKYDPANLHSFRERVLRDIRLRKAELRQSTEQWFQSLPTHVQQAYLLPDGDVVQVPLFIELLRGCSYPATETLEEALSRGFPVLGRIEPSPGWRPRLDDKYDHPISDAAFTNLNNDYVNQKLRQGRVDSEWETWLQEVLQEVSLGRMSGPYEAPSAWPRRCVPVASHSAYSKCLPAESDTRVATAFSVVQQGSDGARKVRRCEDYMRSGHNSTIHVSDIPAHDDISRYVHILLRLNAAGCQSLVWCQDLWAAYRQFPVQVPNHAFALLLTPSGPTLWRHGVLPFGAASSVWCFNKCVDALVFFARSLMMILVIHFVDDIGCPDAQHSANSSFRFFSEFCEVLGMRLKPSKAQSPALEHKLLGVILEICLDGVRLSPAPDRLEKVLQIIKQSLADDCLEPTVAQRLTGKLNFLSTTLFGQAAAAAMKPLYARAHICNSQEASTLNQPLRCALMSLQTLLRHSMPRWVPFQPTCSRPSVLYADAFFELGDQSFGLSDSPPERWQANSSSRYRNGFGFVVRSGSEVRFAHGSIPADLLALFTSRRAYIYIYIYCLEIFGQVIAAITCRDMLSENWIGFCDNMAGKAALIRGYGRDSTVNNLLACFWALAQRLRWQPHLNGCRAIWTFPIPFREATVRLAGRTTGGSFPLPLVPCGPFSAEWPPTCSTLLKALLLTFCGFSGSSCEGRLGLDLVWAAGRDEAAWKCLCAQVSAPADRCLIVPKRHSQGEGKDRSELPERFSNRTCICH